MYVPHSNANLPPAKLIRALFFKYPNLYTDKITLLSRATFTSDPPNMEPGRRSRIGDRIFLFDSPTLTEKLRPYSEDMKFMLNKSFSVTLKGGLRGNSVAELVSPDALSKVMKSSAGEAMANAQEGLA